ncbi:hypothetical protein CAL12_24325 [Bordetella genomosp. 8]|uniref:Uncharacterized protein n=1 Tax=Bordetella genomosp. 8 TaxID=1416806 RepID=A0A1W6YR99_9BORD|nr:hypothetical protein [Bordetella genomosp. 8]ARP83626.1 hypothetical protein CAL12_24325 [Bordetella genomosp. 8]
MNPTPLWSAADIQAHCQRYGLQLPEPLMRRMQELSTDVSLAGMGIARMPAKDREPALVFDLPAAAIHREET